jgi:malate dehydrogenase (oxaloacetate-decarboxylating)(NADP+)
MSIPVFHDDQHGTAIISGAALLNAVEVSGKKLEDLRVVFCGGGAASIACAKFWLSLGVKKENCIMTDKDGVVYVGRKEDMNPEKDAFALQGNAWHKKAPRTLADAMKDADVFMGCSVGNVVTAEMLKSLRAEPIVFAMANPNPEITYEVAMAARQDMILYGKTEKDVIFYNHITEDWEFLKSYHAEIEEISDTYNTEDEAISVLEALEDDEDDFENADEELKEAYDDYVRNFKKQRNSYYGWCKNNNDNSFNKMYGNGEPKTFKEFCNDL